MGERASRWLRRLLFGGIWIAAGYYFLFGGEYSLSELRTLEAERDSLATRVESLQAVAGSLDRRADALRESDHAIERTAREEYGFIRDGEHLYRFVGEDSGQAEDGVGTGVEPSGRRQ